ncbi:MAG: hypothetical protein ABI251_10020, partial [Mycobacteriaceae bacterium]
MGAGQGRRDWSGLTSTRARPSGAQQRRPPRSDGKLRLGLILEHATLLFGRGTWDLFRTLWPQRDAPFSPAMNAVSTAVLTIGPWTRPFSGLRAYPQLPLSGARRSECAVVLRREDTAPATAASREAAPTVDS